MMWLIWFCVGWFFGSGVMWFWFHRSGLIRSREEWELHRRPIDPNLLISQRELDDVKQKFEDGIK